jgi:outer membrane lipoprotein-sorting protein
MRRLLLACGCLAALAAPAARAAVAKRPATLSAAQIADRNVKARGGLRAWQAVRALRLSGEMDAGGKSDAGLPFALFLKRPHKSRLELTFADKNAVQVYDGTQGWKLRPYLNRDDVEPFKPEELASAESAAELDGPLVDYARKGTRVELAGSEKVEGKETYKLKLTSKGGKEQFLWLDAVTFLEAKISGEPRKLDGRPHKVEIYCRDYRTVNGLKVPFVLETAVEGVKQRYKMTIRSVKVNPPLEDALFAKPTIAMTRVTAAARTP